jgi:hypothetical protein
VLCWAHCLRSAPMGPRAPAVLPGGVGLRPPTSGAEKSPRAPLLLSPRQQTLGTTGARAPPAA